MNESQKEAVSKLAEIVESLAAYLYPTLGEVRYKQIADTCNEVKSTMNE